MIDQLPDVGEVMVVVLGDEEEMIDEPHRGFEARMRDGAGEGRFINLGEAVEKLNAAATEVEEDVFERTGVVIGFVGSAVLEVGRGEAFGSCDEIVDAGEP